MPGVPLNFQAISNVLANYNFVDIASGTGYINFYAGTTVDLKLLSNNTFYSDAIVSSVALGQNTGATLIIDYDFDVLLNRPLDIEGLGIVNTPLGATSTTTETVAIYAIISFSKWDGSSESVIVSNTSSTINDGNGPTSAYGITATDLTIPLTHFKIGEYIRLTVQVYASHTGTNAATGILGHDPKSRVTGFDGTGAVPSQLIFQCPVRLNL